MNNKTLKGLEPFIIKAITILVSVLYLLSPLYNQVSSVLHILSHELHTPESILSHDQNESNFHSEENQIHKNHTHDHEVIELFNNILKESNLITEPLLASNKVKFDKHIPMSISVDLNKTIINLIKKSVFSPVENLTQKGFPKKIEAPPKQVIS